MTAAEQKLVAELQVGKAAAEQKFVADYGASIQLLIKWKAPADAEIRRDIEAEVQLALFEQFRDPNFETTRWESLAHFVRGVTHVKIANWYKKNNRYDYLLSDSSLRCLDSQGVSRDVINTLELVVNRLYARKDKCLEAVQRRLDPEQFNSYKTAFKHCMEKVAKLLPTLEVDVNSPESSLIETETRGILGKLVEQLPQEERRLIQLRYEQEMAVKEIATHLNLPAQKVSNRLYQLHQKLYRAFRKQSEF